MIEAAIIFARGAGSHLWAIFLTVFVFDLPRYTLSFLSVALDRLLGRRDQCGIAGDMPAVTVMVPVLNDPSGVLRTLHSVARQTVRPTQIIVIDDGSTDATPAVLAEARARGLLDLVVQNDRRLGLGGALNRGLMFATGAALLTIDSDTEIAPDAIAELLARLAAPGVAAVSGNIGVRNADASLWTGLQQIEYMISIDLGRSFMDRLDAMACCSGAFSMFDVEALRRAGGFGPGSGQDLEVTLRLRKAGHHVRFARRAWASTDVPTSFARLARQRLRWDRDALRLHLFQYHQLHKAERETLGGSLQRYDFILFNLLPTIALIPLIATLAGMSADIFLGFASFAYLLLLAIELGNIAIAVLLYRGRISPFALALWPILPLYTGFLMKAVRLWAYASEAVWHASRRDGFVPARVRQILYRRD